MNVLKKLPMIFGMFFLVTGLILFVADLFHVRKYGIDIFSGYEFVTDNGQAGDAPAEAGDLPAFLFIPAYVYSLACWVMAAMAFAFLPVAERNDAGRLPRGTE